MMTFAAPFVLIIAIIGFQDRNSIHHVPFNEQAPCDAAAERVMKWAETEQRSKGRGTAIAFCAPTGK